AVRSRGRDRPELGGPQRVFVAPVGALDRAVGGVRAAVVFEVQLADPHRQLGMFVAYLLPKRRDRVDLDARRTLEVGQAPRGFEHGARRSATAVTESERIQRMLRLGVL